MSHSIMVVGLLKEKYFHKAKHVMKWLSESQPECFGEPVCEGLMEHRWLEYTHQIKKSHPEFKGDVAVFLDNELLGNLQSVMEMVVDNYDYLDQSEWSEFEQLARDAYNTVLANPQRDYVFMDIAIEGDLIGRLVFELFKDLCPMTCANFVALCSGEKGSSSDGTRLSYVNSLFHRVVRGGWLQGGDICGGSGSKGLSIYGATFNDESFAVKHSNAGVVGMANHGRNTNNSQFYITLTACPWMDKKYVAFGQIVEGLPVLKKLEEVSTYNERPTHLCQVSNCGCLPLSQ